MHLSSNPFASLLRRIAALAYDCLTITAFLMLMTLIALVVNNGDSFGANNPYFFAYLIICTGLFQCWFWCKSGQSIGMLAWKLKLVDNQGKLLKPSMAIKRYLISIPCLWFFGIGYLWAFIDKDNKLLQDRLTGSSVLMLKNISGFPPSRG